MFFVEIHNRSRHVTLLWQLHVSPCSSLVFGQSITHEQVQSVTDHSLWV